MQARCTVTDPEERRIERGPGTAIRVRVRRSLSCVAARKRRVRHRSAATAMPVQRRRWRTSIGRALARDRARVGGLGRPQTGLDCAPGASVDLTKEMSAAQMECKSAEDT